MDKGIDTVIQTGRTLRRAEEALMNLPSHGYRQSPLEPEDENEALEASETPPADVDDDILTRKKQLERQDLRPWKSRSCNGS